MANAKGDRVTIDLQALKEKRDAAIRTFSCWECSAETLLEAYAQGERDFRRATLYGANLSGANLSGANLSGANLDGANLYGANLYGANLDGANLDGANLSGATLYGATLSGATLYGATLYGATLSGANLDGATLYGANLDGATLDGATLSGANLDGANLPEGFSIIQIGPVGSRRGYTVATRINEVNKIRTGCFSGSLDEFITAVARKDTDDPYRREYETLVIPVLKAFFAQFEAKSEEA